MNIKPGSKVWYVVFRGGKMRYRYAAVVTGFTAKRATIVTEHGNHRTVSIEHLTRRLTPCIELDRVWRAPVKYRNSWVRYKPVRGE